MVWQLPAAAARERSPRRLSERTSAETVLSSQDASLELFEEASACRSETSSGVSVEEESPESVVSSQELGSVWWVDLIKMHTSHLTYDDSNAAPWSLVSTCSGMLSEAFAMKACQRFWDSTTYK